MIYPFERDPKSGMIFITVRLDRQHSFKMVLDIGASCTTFDTSALYLADYTIGGISEKCAIETANGIVEVAIFKVDSLAALGITIRNMPVLAYDFLSHGILSDYEGVLGIDFFENTEFTINMKKFEPQFCPLDRNHKKTVSILSITPKNL